MLVDGGWRAQATGTSGICGGFLKVGVPFWVSL